MTAVTATRVSGGQGWVYASTTETFDEERGIDFMAVELAINGDRDVSLNLAERIEAARILDGRGYQPTEISRLIHADPGSVSRWKARGWAVKKEVKRPRKIVPDECGTPFMYRRHLDRLETPCDACKEAARIQRREHRQKRRDQGLRAR